jgi:alginate O-acetyltransferase complex protein AlgI
MIFSDARFIFLFLPLAWVILALARRTGQPLVVAATFIAVSFAFYLQWNPSDFIVVISSVLLNFAIANSPLLRRSVKLVLCISLNVGYLVFLKYFVATGLIPRFAAAGNLFGALGLPLGISFITFLQIMFVVDQAEGRDREPNPIRYLFFVLFFPHLIAGPLVRHRMLCGQIGRKAFLRPPAQFLRVGFAYFAIGMAKKLVIAEPLLTVNNELFKATAELSAVEAWFNAFIYSFRIYFDFSAYSDMATGLAYLFGIQFPRNFQSPYKARDIFEFWRTWHITLYRFFRQYLYLRLMRLPIFVRRAPMAMVIVLTLSAMWHGVGWGYMLWGCGHAGLMITTRGLAKLGILRSRRPAAGFRRIVATATTFTLVTVLWLPFAINNLGGLRLYLPRLVAPDFGISHLTASMLLLLATPLIITFAAPNSHQLCLGGRRRAWLIPFAAALFALAAPFSIGRQSPPPPFIYFQF